MRQVEAALRLAGLDAASIRRVAEGGAMQDALVIRARAGGIVTEAEHQARPARSTSDPLVRVADTGKLARHSIAGGASVAGDGAAVKWAS